MSIVNYTREYGSQLPDSVKQLNNFTDVTDAQAALINQIKELQAQQRYDEANAIITANDLQRSILSSEYINQLDEETRNLEIMCKANQQAIYYTEDEPGYASNGDVWISSVAQTATA